MTAFVHLRVHTEYSLVDGVVRIDELVEAAAAAGMPALAVTDQCNLFAMVKFYRAAQAAGIKPIVGVDVWIRDADERAEPSRLTLLCMNQQGYGNLTRLVSRSYLEGQRRGVPMLERGWLEPGTVTGLIALSGGAEGDVGRHLGNGRVAEAHRAARAGWTVRSDWSPNSACRWWRPTTCASSSPPTSRRTRRASASTTARSWPTRRGRGATPSSST